MFVMGDTYLVLLIKVSGSDKLDYVVPSKPKRDQEFLSLDPDSR